MKPIKAEIKSVVEDCAVISVVYKSGGLEVRKHGLLVHEEYAEKFVAHLNAFDTEIDYVAEHEALAKVREILKSVMEDETMHSVVGIGHIFTILDELTESEVTND